MHDVTRPRPAPTTYATAYAALARAQKPPAGVSVYSRCVNRPLGRLVAASAAALGLRPNQVTVLSALLSVVAVVTLGLSTPGPTVGVVVAVLLVGSFVFDAADGQLARLQGGGSATGEWFDHVVDAGKGVGVHGGVLVMAFRHFAVPVAWFLVPLAFVLVSTLMFSAGTLRDLLGRQLGVSRSTGRVARRWSALALLPVDSGVIALSFVTLGYVPVFVVLYPVLLVANVVVGALLAIKWWRELRLAPGSGTSGPGTSGSGTTGSGTSGGHR